MIRYAISYIRVVHQKLQLEGSKRERREQRERGAQGEKRIEIERLLLIPHK